jgi:hypothetical protein
MKIPCDFGIDSALPQALSTTRRWVAVGWYRLCHNSLLACTVSEMNAVWTVPCLTFSVVAPFQHSGTVNLAFFELTDCLSQGLQCYMYCDKRTDLPSSAPPDMCCYQPKAYEKIRTYSIH